MPEHKPMYPYSLKEAVSLGEKNLWRESYRENCNCARAIERAIDEHYDGQRLEPCAEEVIDRYGFDRVNFVLANTLRQAIEDGRYSEDNKKWARRFSVIDKENTWQYCVRSHPGLVDLFVADARRLWDKLGLYDSTGNKEQHKECKSDRLHCAVDVDDHAPYPTAFEVLRRCRDKLPNLSQLLVPSFQCVFKVL